MKIKMLPAYDLLIIDGQHLAYRCFYAYIRLKTSSNIASGLIYGFLRCLLSYKKDYGKRICKVVIAWEGEDLERKKLLPSYKAGRKKPHVDFLSQLADLKELLCAGGINQYYAKGYEADDVIYYLADKYSAQERDVLIISGDKDMRQQVSDKGVFGAVHVLNPRNASRKTDDLLDYKATALLHKINKPIHLVAYLALAGDKVDNITKVGKFSEDKALKLVQQAEQDWATSGVGIDFNQYHLKKYITNHLEDEELIKKFLFNYDLIDLSKILYIDPSPICRRDNSKDESIVARLLDKYEIRKYSFEDFN